MKNWRVVIGPPARRRTIVVSAETREDALEQAVDTLASRGEDREWLENQVNKGNSFVSEN